jgi:hypothetical protein
MTTTLTVLATLVAVPFLVGVLLAVGLGFFMALHFAAEWTRGFRSGSGLSPQDRAVECAKRRAKIVDGEILLRVPAVAMASA